MNKGYAYMDGKAIICDEFGNQTQSEYYDNLEKVLVKENLIEEMENRIFELMAKKERLSINARKKIIPTCLYCTIAAILATPVLYWCASGTNPYLYNVESIFGSINHALLLTSVFAAYLLPIPSLEALVYYVQHKANKRNLEGVDSELEILKSLLENEKTALANLKEEKTINIKDIDFKSVKIDDKEQLKILRDYLELYYDLGSNKEKYYHYYQQGKLDKKLQKYYNEAGIELAKEYLEVNGPILTRKKK